MGGEEEVGEEGGKEEEGRGRGRTRKRNTAEEEVQWPVPSAIPGSQKGGKASLGTRREPGLFCPSEQWGPGESQSDRSKSENTQDT